MSYNHTTEKHMNTCIHILTSKNENHTESDFTTNVWEDQIQDYWTRWNKESEKNPEFLTRIMTRVATRFASRESLTYTMYDMVPPHTIYAMHGCRFRILDSGIYVRQCVKALDRRGGDRGASREDGEMNMVWGKEWEENKIRGSLIWTIIILLSILNIEQTVDTFGALALIYVCMSVSCVCLSYPLSHCLSVSTPLAKSQSSSV